MDCLGAALAHERERYFYPAGTKDYHKVVIERAITDGFARESARIYIAALADYGIFLVRETVETLPGPPIHDSETRADTEEVSTRALAAVSS